MASRPSSIIKSSNGIQSTQHEIRDKRPTNIAPLSLLPLREVWRFQNFEIPLKISFRNFKETYKWIYRQVIRVVEIYDVGKPTKRNNPSRSRDVYFTLNVCFQTSQPTEELRTSERKKERGLPEITVIGYWNNSQSAEKLVAARFDDTVRSDSNCVRKQENRSFYKITIQQQENDVQLPSSYT